MKIAGFQKLTLLDFPRQVACIVFTSGCNMRCPFCHNAGLVMQETPSSLSIPDSEVFDYLKIRKGLLDGVVISGGEPLLNADIADFIRKARKLGYLIKLDTNGSFPERLSKLLEEHLLDYVAMDIKNSPEHYSLAIGKDASDILPNIEKSITLLKGNGIPFEFRTTLVNGIHNEYDVESIAKWISGDQPYYLQSYVDSDTVLCPENLTAFSGDALNLMLVRAQRYCPNAAIRNI